MGSSQKGSHNMNGVAKKHDPVTNQGENPELKGDPKLKTSQAGQPHTTKGCNPKPAREDKKKTGGSPDVTWGTMFTWRGGESILKSLE